MAIEAEMILATLAKGNVDDGDTKDGVAITFFPCQTFEPSETFDSLIDGR